MSDAKTTLLTKEMTRKEFLIYASMAALSVFGIKNFINLFMASKNSVLAQSTANASQEATDGFGARKFGA